MARLQIFVFSIIIGGGEGICPRDIQTPTETTCARVGWHRGWHPGVYWRAPVPVVRPYYYGPRYRRYY